MDSRDESQMNKKNISFKKKAQDNSIDVRKLTSIKGFPLDKNLKVSELLENYKSIGFQASHIGKAVDIIKTIKKEKAELFLASTSNMVSSGLREGIETSEDHTSELH